MCSIEEQILVNETDLIVKEENINMIGLQRLL